MMDPDDRRMLDEIVHQITVMTSPYGWMGQVIEDLTREYLAGEVTDDGCVTVWAVRKITVDVGRFLRGLVKDGTIDDFDMYWQNSSRATLVIDAKRNFRTIYKYSREL